MEKRGTKSHRVRRVERELQIQVAQYLSAAYKGELPGLVTVSGVRMPADLRSARVAVSFFNASPEEAEQGIEVLQRWRYDIQSYLASKLPLRYCPKVQFELDYHTEKVNRVESLLRELSQQGAPS